MPHQLIRYRSVWIIGRMSMVLALAAAMGCSGGDDEGSNAWPPRAGQNDALAAKIDADAELIWEIPTATPVKWNGSRDLIDGEFIPVEGEFEVVGGQLISRVGLVEKRATVSGWTVVRNGTPEGKVVGWGVCLTDGELIVPNLFAREAPAGKWVANAFTAENLGDRFTLIRLEAIKSDRFCLLYRPPQTGYAMFGSMRATGSATITGICTDEFEGDDSGLFLTTGFIGSKAREGDRSFLRKADGWYYGDRKITP